MLLAIIMIINNYVFAFIYRDRDMYMLLSRIFWVYIAYLQVITWHGSSTQESQLCMNPCSLLEERRLSTRAIYVARIAVTIERIW